MSNRYDNGVLQADASIGQALALLRARGRLDDALVVITGDHGESLGERGHFGHSWTLDKEVLDVPLLIWDSRGRCCAPQAYASQLDIAPTILRSLGLPIPASWQGLPLQDPAPARRRLYVQTPTPEP
jgi:arylsulfatase A-like enzyme